MPRSRDRLGDRRAQVHRGPARLRLQQAPGGRLAHQPRGHHDGKTRHRRFHAVSHRCEGAEAVHPGHRHQREEAAGEEEDELQTQEELGRAEEAEREERGGAEEGLFQ